MVAAKDQDGTVKTTPVIHYDKRARNTDIEHDRDSALYQIETIRRNIRAMTPEVLSSPVQGAFMLSAEGTEFAFESTLSREMAFAVHHCIHHNALVKVLLQQHFPDVSLPQQFGMAPSTLNFNMLETS
ncbi:hypothetical protein Poli38472_005924 [Pythium oligandrum]|uniref:DinB-like domain-containing protein n=1 Tax=Pythium oligandrum TaxID=41045 RepID=A0A8K1CTR8_PYTOL|nr:hypothetical protein Poli38472_005924 [Pythium oligandrum]|eukprot:TMW68456.1 hypothetical protein Poli38472_005924 [Pythium oligandrum]